ncbi:MAG: hypothetical protein HC896_14355 [Bacteroidales bacterium]|nr:hypothetical protein [Bacteroidales bacterium]
MFFSLVALFCINLLRIVSLYLIGAYVSEYYMQLAHLDLLAGAFCSPGHNLVFCMD